MPTVKINIDQQGNKVSIRDNGPGLTSRRVHSGSVATWHRAGNLLEQTEGSGASVDFADWPLPKK